ncbi:MAG: shikimate kinase [Aequorivita sp.]|nr:shikimate kinase [Aequorivita sp.]|tara:strand:+ start:683 stop:1204 length:522 start_codon:yes stop_codon:yes gene_type:complete
MKIILMGYMGSGKSSVGKKLASALQLPFKDMDSEIEKAEGSSVSEIFAKKGEIYFRRVENQILKNLLQQADSFVLATGGGTPCYGDAIEVILKTSKIISIYLKAPIPTLVRRLYDENDGRPLLAHLNSEEVLEDFIRKHLFERAFYYNQAHMTVEAGEENTDKIVENIIAGLF